MDMIELHCRTCKRSVEFLRSQFPDVPAWVARIEHDRCNVCDNGDFSAEHWIAADGATPDPDTMPTADDDAPMTPPEDAARERGYRPPVDLEPAVRAVCERLLADMRATARSMGWAVAVHGSMVRDLDVVGIPWTEDAADETAFVEAMRASVARELRGKCYVADRLPNSMEHRPADKPHGRRSFTLHALSDDLVHSPAGAHPFIDLCVMDLRAILAALSGASADQQALSAAVDQNAAMRQELAHVGNLISDLARAMNVDQADAGGSWPDLAGRIGKLHAAALSGRVGDVADSDRAVEILNRHCEYMDGLKSGQRWIGTDAALRAVNEAVSLATTAEARVQELERALRAIVSIKPKLETYAGRPHLRCSSCAYRWDAVEEERHSAHCAYVAARAALGGGA